MFCKLVLVLRDEVTQPAFQSIISQMGPQMNFQGVKCEKVFIAYLLKSICTINGPQRKKTCLLGFANNTGADQPAHLRSLINSFVIRFLESTICKLATGEISIH